MAKTKYIKTPEQLWELFEKYQESLQILKIPQSHVKLGVVYLEVKEPMTFEGFECWLADNDIIQDLGHYSANTDSAYEAYRTIITRIRKNIYSHNFNRAAVGLYKENLIARQLGMADKVQESGDKQITVKIVDESTSSYDPDITPSAG
jgi:hypothetical protein